MNNDLKELLENYENLRENFRLYIDNGEVRKEGLIEFQGRFTDLKADLRPFINQVYKGWIRRDDKASTAIKFRIALAIHKGEFKDEKGNLIFDACSINQAEKLASGSEPYKKFLEERAFYRESYVNLNDLRADVESYLIECSVRIREY